MYVQANVRTYVGLSVHVLCMYVCKYAYVCACVRALARARVCVCVCLCSYIDLCVCIYIRIPLTMFYNLISQQHL